MAAGQSADFLLGKTHPSLQTKNYKLVDQKHYKCVFSRNRYHIKLSVRSLLHLKYLIYAASYGHSSDGKGAMVSENRESPIGLSELIEQVKQELLSTTPSKDNIPILFVDSVELQLQVTVKREGRAGVKVDVVSIGGGELGAGISRDDIHQVKVKLSPIFSKEKLLEIYQTLHSDQISPMVKQGLDAFLKGNTDGLNQQF